MEDMRFSRAQEMFYNLLRIMFAIDVESEEQAVFAKQLVDYIIQHVDDCREKGLVEEMLPIAYISVWQGVKVHNRGIFSIRAKAGVETSQDNNLSELLENLKETVFEWGDKTLGGIVKLKEGDSEVTYELAGDDNGDEG